MRQMVLGALTMAMVALLFPAGQADAREFELKFVPGSSYGVASDAVIRGDLDNYYFEARAGQAITIAVTSVEDNAVVELSVLRGGVWVPVDGPVESRVLYGPLPSSDGGAYRITVSGTRGNATYDLFVGISVI